MSVYRTDFKSIPEALRSCAVTIGNFDGVHLGHQALIRALLGQASNAGVQSVAVTFDPPPAALLRKDFKPSILTRLDQRAALLQQYGVEHVVILETTHELLGLSAEAFFQEILVDQFEIRGIVEGSNFYFGKGRSGNVQTLQELCDHHQIPCEIVADQFVNGLSISSSTIRQQVLAGDLQSAQRFLGRPYALQGTVVHGQGRGRSLGFPTANLANIQALLPPFGIYSGQCQIDDGKYAVATHIGPNVTFEEEEATIESYILDYDGDLYDRELTVELFQKIRGPEKFSSVESLKAQIHDDVEVCRAIFKNHQRLAVKLS